MQAKDRLFEEGEVEVLLVDHPGDVAEMFVLSAFPEELELVEEN